MTDNDDIDWVDGIPFKKPEHEGPNRGNNPDGKNLRVETAAWIKKHKNAAELFLSYARQLLANGRRFGIGQLAERVRWEVNFEWGDCEFKVNNNYRAYIARWMIAIEPALERLISFRKVRY